MSSNDGSFTKYLRDLELGIDEKSIKMRRRDINTAFNHYIGVVRDECEANAKKSIHHIDGYVHTLTYYGDGSPSYEWVDAKDFDDTKYYLPNAFLNLTKEEMEDFKNNIENELRSLGFRDIILTVSSYQRKTFESKHGIFRDKLVAKYSEPSYILRVQLKW